MFVIFMSLELLVDLIILLAMHLNMQLVILFITTDPINQTTRIEGVSINLRGNLHFLCNKYLRVEQEKIIFAAETVNNFFARAPSHASLKVKFQ